MTTPLFQYAPWVMVGLSLQDFTCVDAYATDGATRKQWSSKSPLREALKRRGYVGQMFYNMGISGATATSVLTHWPTDIINIPQPGILCFCNGGNDIQNISGNPVLATGGSGIENVLTTYFNATLKLFNQARSLGMNIIMEGLPDNGVWTGLSFLTPGAANSNANGIAVARMASYYRMDRWHKEYSRAYGIPYINYNAGVVYPAMQLAQAASSVVGNGTTTTVTLSSAMPTDWKNGDMIQSPDSSAAQTAPVAITLTSTTVFTYASTFNGTASTAGHWQRMKTKSLLFTTPGTGTHWNAAGAVQCSYIAEDALFNGRVDFLSCSEQDGENLVGVGTAATDHNHWNAGQFIAAQGSETAGTFSGTWNTTSGTVARGWTASLVNTSTGATCVASLQSFPASDPARSSMQSQRLVITAGSGADAEVELYIQHSVPTAWAATTGYSLGNWVTPATANGYYYVCVQAGTSGGSQPTFPTSPGLQVTDNGTLIWECRRGWLFDGNTKYHVGGEMRLIAQTQTTDAYTGNASTINVVNNDLLSHAILISDDSNSYVIGDGTVEDANQTTTGPCISPPNWPTGSHFTYHSPDYVLRAAGSTNWKVTYRVWVRKGGTVTLDFARPTVYRSGWGQVDQNGNVQGAI